MAIVLRDIYEDDLELIMKWRMSESVTKYMNTNPKLTIEEQKKWFDDLKHRTDTRHWIILSDDKPIGIICLLDIDWAKKTTSWGYYIGEVGERRLKTAISLELSLYAYVFEELNFLEIHNEVFSLNEGVIKLHIGCGNHVVKEVKEEVEKEGIKYDITHLSISREKWKEISSIKKYERVAFSAGYSVNHIGVAVQDMQKAVNEYLMLGYECCGNIVHDTDRKIDIVFIRNKSNDTVLELIQPHDENNPVEKTLAKMNGLTVPYHICYETDNIERTINEFKARKYIVLSKVSPAQAFDGRRVVFLLKKDTGLIEFVEV